MRISQGFTMFDKYSERWRFWFLSLLGSGKIPWAPGTMGSLVALLMALPILLFSANTLFALASLLGVIAVKQIDAFERHGGEHDAGWIVIDELVGLWVALSLVPFSLFGVLGAFVFFRIFDIWKPSLVGYFDSHVKGGLGVVGDDVIAGVLAGLCTAGIIKILTFL